MKIWFSYGTEHSANLVMIGRFKTAEDATEANRAIEAITDQVELDVSKGHIVLGQRPERFSEEMRELLGNVNVITIGHDDLEQFAMDVNVELKGKNIVVTTDEIDVSGFLKIFIAKGAKVEIYSAHDYDK